MKSFLFSLAIAAFAGNAFGQTTTGTTTGTTGGAGAITSGGNSGFQGMQLEGAPTISGGTSTGANVNSSNAFGQFYANPLYGGAPGSNGLNNPGGFGTALSGGGTGARTSGFANRSGVGGGYGSTGTTANRTSTTGTTTGSRTGSTGGTSITAPAAGSGFGSGFGGSTGGFGGNTGGRNSQFGGIGGFGNTGGFGGTGRNSMMGGNTQQQAGLIAPQSRSVAHTVNVRLPQRVVNHQALAAELNSSLARSSFLSNPAGITATHDGQTVTLRGQVKDEDEARTAEGVVRLTPGVRAVKNELVFPK